jgi:heavy metal sensor kinase
LRAARDADPGRAPAAMARRLSIGTRWALRYTVAMAVTLAVFAVVVYSQIEARINREARLVTEIHAQALLESLRGQTEEHPPERVREWLAERLANTVRESAPDLDLGLEYLDPRGEPVLAAGSLARVRTPLPQDLLRGEREHSFRAVNLGAPHAHIATALAAPGGFLRVAIDTRRYAENLAHVRDVFLVSFPLVLLLTGGLGWLLARGSLRPISDMTATARRISGSNLSERVPGTGAADELDQLAHTLNAMIERIDQSVGQMRRFNANAAHELRTPLALVCSQIELAFERKGDAEEHARVLRDVLARVQHLARAVDALLRLSQLDLGLDRERLVPVSVAELLGTVVEFFEPMAAQEGRKLSGGPYPEAHVLGDRAWLLQLFSNLVDNAIKYCAEGDRIRIAAELGDGRVVATVSDTGPGIPPDVVRGIFDRFQRGRPPRDREGFGLGLALAREIARAHGGDIAVTSDGRVGTTFSVTLPTAAAPVTPGAPR